MDTSYSTVIDMKKIILFFLSILAFSVQAQNNLPPCNGDYTGPCFGAYDYPISGDKYVGQFKNRDRNGQGTYTFANGNTYIGQFKDNKINGQGTYFWASGSKYVGQWKDEKRNGQGTFTFADGRKYVGQWKDDKYDGFGTFYLANGSIYQQGLWGDNLFVQAQIPTPVIPPVVPEPIDNERKKLEEERRQLAEERRKLEEEKRKLITKPPANNAQDIKRQKCIRLGLLPDSADFKECMK